MDNPKDSRLSAHYLSSLRRKQSDKSFLHRSFSSRRSSEDVQVNINKNPVGLTTISSLPERSQADIIFIHGLGGGSRSTWCKDGDLSFFWPQIWLSRDPAFKDVRIHTFGYDSNWLSDSNLNIHDFAKSLLERVKNSPSIYSDENVGPGIPEALIFGF